jgi:hypothetical protein
MLPTNRETAGHGDFLFPVKIELLYLLSKLAFQKLK